MANIFMRVDQWIFERISDLKETVPYQKFQDILSNMDEEVRAKVAPILVIFLFVIPVPIIGVFWKLNSNFKEQLKTKQEIINKASFFLGQKQEVSNALAQIDPNGPFSQDQFKSRITGQATGHRINASKLTIQNIAVNPISTDLAEVSGQILFKELAHNQFSSLLDILTAREGLSISGLEINALKQEKLLSGSLQFKKLTGQPQNPEAEQ